MRGKESHARRKRQAHGITPAYAGKSLSAGHWSARSGDHPRVCGEKGSLPMLLESQRGSPPRMRGKASGQQSDNDTPRITPAYAGKSRKTVGKRSNPKDHPRVCGEKRVVSSQTTTHPGSPPRMRGKGNPARRSCLHIRITPAYAGKRLKRSRSTVPPVAIVPLFPSVCNKPVVSDGSPAGRDAPLFLPAENAVPASPAYNLRSL